MTIGADKVVLPRRVYYVALTANTSTTTALDLQEVIETLFGAGASYKGQYWRFACSEDFYMLAGNQDVPTIDLTVDNDGDEGWPVFGKQVEDLVSTGEDTRYLKFRGGSVGATVAIYAG